MAKLNTKFVNYFLFGMLFLAFIAPMTHCVYEGLEQAQEEQTQEEQKEEPDEDEKI